MNLAQKFDQRLVACITRLTTDFVCTKLGQWFLSLALVGPATFLPTVWEAWTAQNIDALRTMTWPSAVVINISVMVSLCYNGDWRIRLSMVVWIILMSLVWLATIVR